MPKLINPTTGETVSATPAGAAVLRNRGYEDYAPKAQRKAPAEPKQPKETEPKTGWPETHAALDEIAAGIDGFEWPPPPEGKQKLTVAEKVAALKSAGATPPSSGE